MFQLLTPAHDFVQRKVLFVLVFYTDPLARCGSKFPAFPYPWPKPTSTLDWCIVRLGEDHNWWVAETSDPVRWDVDGLSIIDPRQLAHLIELVDAAPRLRLRPGRVRSARSSPSGSRRTSGAGKVRLKRVKESLFESDEKLFALPDVLDEENGPYADLLDHLTRCRVKMLNDLFDFESKLSVDEVEDEIREDQNAHFIEGKAVHVFEELCAILDYMPAGHEIGRGAARARTAEEEDDDLPELDEDEEEKLKNDESLKWDEDDEEDEDDGA